MFGFFKKKQKHHQCHDWVLAASRDNCSNLPVKTARYLVEVVMNEDDPDEDSADHIRAFEDEFQRTLDDNYFVDLRYNALSFRVISRDVIDVCQGNDTGPVEPIG